MEASVLNNDIFEKIIDTYPDTKKTTETSVSLVYNLDHYRIEVEAKKKDGFEPVLEEACWYDGDHYIEYDLTEEQMEKFAPVIENCHEDYLDYQRDIKEYNRDIYAYHGMSRSDFM